MKKAAFQGGLKSTTLELIKAQANKIQWAIQFMTTV